MKKKQIKKRLKRAGCGIFWVLMLLSVLAVCAYAGEESESMSVSEAVEQTWLTARGEIMNVVNRVVFPVIDLILAILLFVKVSMAYMDYRKRGQFEWTGPAILLFTLIFSLTAPLYIWYLI